MAIELNTKAQGAQIAEGMFDKFSEIAGDDTKAKEVLNIVHAECCLCLNGSTTKIISDVKRVYKVNSLCGIILKKNL